MRSLEAARAETASIAQRNSADLDGCFRSPRQQNDAHRLAAEENLDAAVSVSHNRQLIII